MFKQVTSVPFTHQDRQWDARFNVQDDKDLVSILDAIRSEADSGKFRYVLVSGIEIGTRPNQDDYQVRHVHVAAVFNNRVTKNSILKNWTIKQGNGYYLVPRNRTLPYSGWRSHHVKEFSKVDPSKLILFEMGELPKDEEIKITKASDVEKKRKVDEILIDIRNMIDEDKCEEAFTKYPRTYLQWGEKIKANFHQKRDFFKTNGDPHIWLHGYPGTGKSAVLSLIYPKTYKKNLYNKFFDLFNAKEHSHVMLEDVDHEALDRLSINFFKTICDESGFPIDQKYKTPQLVRTTVLITSNFTIEDLVFEGMGVESTRAALRRRFWHVNIYALLTILGIKLLPKWERNKLKEDGNDDVSKLFYGWDYAQNMPSCEPLKSAEMYQKMIKDAFYNKNHE